MLSSLTIRGWPRRIDPSSPFPHPFRRSYDDLRLPPHESRYILYSPRLRFGPHESTAKLLVWAGPRLACLDARRGGVVTTVMSLDEVHEVEWGQALLEAWLRLAAHGPGGRAMIRVELNAVGRDLYLPIADAIRTRAYAGAHLSLADEGARLSSLLSTDYRFIGLGRQALLPGAELRRFWFQPRGAGSFLRFIDQTLVPALLVMVTQAELIFVREQSIRGAGRYGAVYSYLPLGSIRGVALVPDPARAGVSLRISLPGGSEVRADVAGEREGALRAFLRETDPRWGGAQAGPELALAEEESP